LINWSNFETKRLTKLYDCMHLLFVPSISVMSPAFSRSYNVYLSSVYICCQLLLLFSIFVFFWWCFSVAYPGFHLGAINLTRIIYLPGWELVAFFPVPLRYSAWQFWKYKSLYLPLGYAAGAFSVSYFNKLYCKMYFNGSFSCEPRLSGFPLFFFLH